MTKRMKRLPFFILVLVAFLSIAATTHDFFLLPEFFFMHKGDNINLHLIEGDQFVKQNEIKYQHRKTTKFMVYDGTKKVDLTLVAKDSAKTLADYTFSNSGQALIEMNRGIEYSDASRDNFSDFLTAQGYDKLAEKVKTSNQFRIKEKHTRFMKTLVAVDNHDGNAYQKDLLNDFEIILKDNPFKRKYGDDLTAQVKFKGKAEKGLTVNLYIKSISGNVYTQTMVTDAKGEVTFSMSREGVFMIRSVMVVPTTDKDADFVSWWASYTFPFSSSDDMPNTYKQFGFGDIH